MSSYFHPISLSSWKEHFDSLSADFQHILVFLSIHAAPMRRVRLKECCGYSHATPKIEGGRQTFAGVPVCDDSWNDKKTNTAIEQLKQQGWIDIADRGEPQCKNDLRERIVHHLHITGQYQRFANVLFLVIGGRYFAKSFAEGMSCSSPTDFGDYIREIRHILLSNNAHELPEALRYLNSNRISKDYFQESWNLLTAIDGINWLRDTEMESRNYLIQFLLLRSLSHLEYNLNAHWTILIESGCDPICDPVTQILILDYALCAGKLDDPKLARFSGQLALLLLGAHRAFVSERYDRLSC
jgi:hypothetical protein